MYYISELGRDRDFRFFEITSVDCGAFTITRSEKLLLIIRNLQSEKTIVNEQEEFYLPEGKFPSEKE